MKKCFVYVLSLVVMAMLSIGFTSCGDDEENVSPSSQEDSSYDYTAKIMLDDEIWNYVSLTAIVTDTIKNKEVAKMQVKPQDNVVGWNSDDFNGKIQFSVKLKEGVEYPEELTFFFTIKVSKKGYNTTLEMRQLNTLTSKNYIGQMLLRYFDDYALSVKTNADNELEIDATAPVYLNDARLLVGTWVGGGESSPGEIRFFTQQITEQEKTWIETWLSFKGYIQYVDPKSSKVTKIPYEYSTSYTINDETIVFQEPYECKVTYTNPTTGKQTTLAIKWGKNQIYHLSDDGNTLTMKDLDYGIDRTYTRK